MSVLLSGQEEGYERRRWREAAGRSGDEWCSAVEFGQAAGVEGLLAAAAVVSSTSPLHQIDGHREGGVRDRQALGKELLIAHLLHGPPSVPALARDAEMTW
jgi:hypothetical protein